MQYFVGGINGVGKSYLLEQLSLRYPEFEIYKGSARLMEYLGLAPGDYAALRGLPDEVKEAAVNEIMESVLQERGSVDRPLIVDAHYIYYKRGELRDATGPWVRHFSGLLLVDAPAEKILQRANIDSSTGKKVRDLLPEGLSPEQELIWLQRYREVTLQKVQEIAGMYQVPAFAVDNSSEGVEYALNRFVEIHARLKFGERYLPKLY